MPRRVSSQFDMSTIVKAAIVTADGAAFLLLTHAEEYFDVFDQQDLFARLKGKFHDVD